MSITDQELGQSTLKQSRNWTSPPAMMAMASTSGRGVVGDPWIRAGSGMRTDVLQLSCALLPTFLLQLSLTATAAAAFGPPPSPESGVISFYVAIDGSDLNDGRTEATAFRTISHCSITMTREAGRDAECVVGPGTYREQVMALGRMAKLLSGLA